ncbi:hypothetical protein ACFQU2_40665 [Siccirubricoccus deserti]
MAAVTLLLLAGLLEPRLPGVPSLTAALSLLYGVLVVGVGGYALYFVMLKRLPPATAAALQCWPRRWPRCSAGRCWESAWPGPISPAER